MIEENIQFPIKDVIKSRHCINENQAKIILEKIKYLFQYERKITLDFKDIKLINNSFLDKLLGDLCENNLDEMKKFIHLENVSQRDKVLIKQILKNKNKKY